jgi:hypothetical protein
VSERFWPIAEPAQADYERLRALVLAGEPLEGLLAGRRFQRRGLPGLISWPRAEPAYLGSLIGARRPPWSGGEDPRDPRLAEAYAFLLGRAVAGPALRAVVR